MIIIKYAIQVCQLGLKVMNDYVKSETSQFYYKKVLLPNTCWGLYDSCAVVL